MRVTSEDTRVDMPRAADARWVAVCDADAVIAGTGVAALIADQQIAIVRTRSDRFFSLSNFDPFSRTFVLARGLVGDHAGVPTIASPIYKQRFALETGQCLDDAAVTIPVYAIRIVEGRVFVSVQNGPLP
jgi:nitrite reductase (NADH) small subunit